LKAEIFPDFCFLVGAPDGASDFAFEIPPKLQYHSLKN
jgi:hypothetical protein